MKSHEITEDLKRYCGKYKFFLPLYKRKNDISSRVFFNIMASKES